MSEEIITFELIRKVEIEERNTSLLTRLPENFYERVKSYLETKRKTLKDRKSLITLKNIERLVESIFNRRERKILNAAIAHVRSGMQPPSNLTEEEKVFFEKVCEILKGRREEILSSLFSAKEEKGKVKLVVFKKNVSSFVGVDSKVYGPFKEGDIARIPEENLKILLEDGVIEEFEIERH